MIRNLKRQPGMWFACLVGVALCGVYYFGYRTIWNSKNPNQRTTSPSQKEFNEQTRKGLIVYLDKFSSNPVARETVTFLKNDNVRFVRGRIPGLATAVGASYSSANHVIYVNFYIPTLDQVSTARLAGSFVHEVWHARSGKEMGIVCIEEEILAFTSQALFLRRRVQQGHAPWLDALNKKISRDSCQPWWACPLESRADMQSALKRFDRLKKKTIYDEVSFMDWLLIKVLAGGWDSLESFVGGLMQTMDQTSGVVSKPSVFGPPEGAIATIQVGLRLRRQMQSKGKDQLTRMLGHLEHDLLVWSSPVKIARVRHYYDQAIVTAKKKVEMAKQER